MLKSAKPDPRPGEPIRGEADAPRPASPRGSPAAAGPKSQRRYEVPESDPLAGLSDRPHAQTVRGQIQRVRLDLLARENERLDRQLRELLEQQKEYEAQDSAWREELLAQQREYQEKDNAWREELLEQQREYQEKDTAWRSGWQNRLLDLSQRVDQLVTEAEAARQSEAEKDDGVELRDTVKPLLLAVLEMLDSEERQAQSTADKRARQLVSPHLGPTGLDSAALQAALQTQARPAEPQAPVPAAAPAPARQDAAAPAAPAAPSDAGAVLQHPEPASAAPRPADREDAALPQAEETASDNELSIEIARLLLPQDSAADSDDLTLTAPETAAPQAGHPAPGPQGEPAGAVEAPDEALVLGTEDTPELAKPRAAAKNRKRAKAAKTEAPATETEDASAAGQAKPAKTFEREQWDAAIRDVTAAVELPDVKPVAAPAEAGAEADAFAGDAELEPEPLPKCLTERWDDPEEESDLPVARGVPAQRRDKGSYRWPFRRLRATIDHDHAAGDRAAGAGRRTRRVGGFDEDTK